MREKKDAGRPNLYTQELLELARDYAVNYGTKYKDIIPTISGLARVLKCTRPTLHRWEGEKDAEHAAIGEVMREIKNEQERVLLNGGLSGAFNSTITKLILSKHNYSDKSTIDHTSSDGTMGNISVSFVGTGKGNGKNDDPKKGFINKK